MAGFLHSPLTGRWSLSDDISVNFIAFWLCGKQEGKAENSNGSKSLESYGATTKT
jgi:hypothetical protein